MVQLLQRPEAFGECLENDALLNVDIRIHTLKTLIIIIIWVSLCLLGQVMF